MIPQGIQTFPGDSRDASCAQHGAEVPPALLQAAALKQNKAQEHRQQKIDVAEPGPFGQEGPIPQLFSQQKNGVKQSPQEKVPPGPVPQAGEAPDQQDVPHPAQLPGPVST